MRVLRHRLVRSVAVLSLAVSTAACSNDVARLNDGFYTGAIPSANTQSMASAQPIDPSQTGSIGQGGVGAYGTGTPTYGASAGTQAVTRSQLPPPPEAAAYQQSPAPGEFGGVQAAAVAPAAESAQTATVPQQRPAAQRAASTAPASPAPAATQTASAPAASGNTVTVQAGDSLNAIASRTGVSVADLRAANGLASDNIRIGQTLNLPSGAPNTQVAALGAPETTLQAQAERQQQASPAQTAAPAQPAPVQAAPAQQPAAPAAASAPAQATTVEQETQVAAIAPASTGISQFRWPVQGRVLSGFGDRVGSRRNDGVNISVPRGTAIKAAENGVVIYAGEGLREFGKTVLVRHENGLVTVYGHADEILVERGANVTRGQDIAKAGMTGETDVPMLHFEVRKDSTPVNPMDYLG